MRIVGLDPASKKFGMVGIEYSKDAQLSVYHSQVLESPAHFDESKRTQYMSHMVGAFLALDKPDVIVSEKPFGMGFSAQYLKELIGGIKSSYWDRIVWQGVSEARRNVIGDGFGGANKDETSKWLLQYNWTRKSKNLLESELSKANLETKEGYDVLDSALHVLCYLIVNEGLKPVIKEKKKKRIKNVIQ